MADPVRIVEVGPRDGLQNEPGLIGVAAKVALVDLLARAGLQEIEIGAFVSPKWVPQMADSAEVAARVAPFAGRFWLLVPNLRGWEAFQAARAGRDGYGIAVFIAASEGFSRANLNCTIAESNDRLRPVVAAAMEAGVPVRGYVSCVTDCPFDGPVAPAAVARAVGLLRDLAPMQVSLGDTIGHGTPETVGAMLTAVLDVAPATALAGHFHDTGGRALANIEVALDAGLRVFDAAVGGLGGCPYAPGAPGNVATEAVMARLTALGHDTGLDAALIGQAADMARAMRGKA